MAFDFYVHGLWIVGAVFMAAGIFLLGNVEWVEGTTEASYGIALGLGAILILFASMMWISSAVNARQEMN